MILITGATGQNGKGIVQLLRSKDVKLRVMVRKPEDAEGFRRDGIDTVIADFDDEASLAAAVRGVARAFLVTPSSDRVEEQQLRFVRIAVENGMRHIVYLSQLHAAIDSPVRFLRYHAAVEQALASSGLVWTNLRPNLYMQALSGFKETISGQGKLFAPITDARVSLVDVRDIAAVAAAALTGEGHDGKTYDITGPEALTHAEIAQQLGQALGRNVEFVSIPGSAFREALVAHHMPEWQAEGLVEDFEHYGRGEAATVSGDVQSVTGHPATPFARFAHDFRDAFLSK